MVMGNGLYVPEFYKENEKWFWLLDNRTDSI